MTAPHKTTLLPLEPLHVALPHVTRNANEHHRVLYSLNDHIALWVASRVGTMWFCYSLAALMIFWSFLQVFLGHTAFDAFPFPFLFFCLGGVMQSLLLPLIMVSQNLDVRHSAIQADEHYKMAQNSEHTTGQILLHLTAQDALLLQLTRSHTKMYTSE